MFTLIALIAFVTNTSLASNVAPTAKSKIAARGPQNCRQDLERGPTLGFRALKTTYQFMFKYYVSILRIKLRSGFSYFDHS